MLVGTVLLVVGYALTPLVELLPVAWRSGWLLGASGALWAGAAFFVVGGNPFMMRVTTPAERDYAFGLQTSLFPLGGFVGALLGGLLPQALAGLLGVTTQTPVPYRYALWLLPLLIAPGVLAVWKTQPQAIEQGTAQRQVEGGRLPIGVLGVMGLVFMLRWVGQVPTTVFFNVYLDAGLHSPTTVIGALMSIGKLMSVPAGLVMPLITGRWGHYRTLFWGMLAMALSLLPIALPPHWAGAGIGFIGMSALFSLTGPTIAVFSQQLVAPRWRSLMMGISGLTMGLGYGGAALAGGYMIAGLGYVALFLCGAGAMLGSAVALWSYFRVPRGELARSGA
jgi:predicted MFS family arabinose efflux permease